MTQFKFKEQTKENVNKVKQLKVQKVPKSLPVMSAFQNNLNRIDAQIRESIQPEQELIRDDYVQDEPMLDEPLFSI